MLKYYFRFFTVIETVVNILISLLFLPLNFFRQSKLPKNNGKVINVLGNGPSLKEDFDKLSNLYFDEEFLVVNSFALTDFFMKLKPKFYILVDPAFFDENAIEKFKKLRNDLFNDLNSKVSWEMYLLMPNAAKNTVNHLIKNKNIKPLFFYSVPILGGANLVNNFLFKHNLANPLFQNVLIAGIFYSIKMQFRKINVWGADHSWHEDFILGQDNMIYTPDKHFYEEGKLPAPHCDEFGRPVKVHEEFYNLTRAFKSYHYLESFAKHEGVEIVNCSSKTWIDAFKRE